MNDFTDQISFDGRSSLLAVHCICTHTAVLFCAGKNTQETNHLLNVTKHNMCENYGSAVCEL